MFKQLSLEEVRNDLNIKKFIDLSPNSTWEHTISSAILEEKKVIVENIKGTVNGIIFYKIEKFGLFRRINCTLPLNKNPILFLKKALRNIHNIDYLKVNYARISNEPKEGIAYIFQKKLPWKKSVLLKGYNRKTRNLIKKSVKRKLKVKISRTEDSINIFYDIYTNRMKRFNVKPRKKTYFNKLIKLFSTAQIFLIIHKKEVIASSIGIIFKEKMYNPFAASKSEKLHLSPNNFLYHSMMEYAIDNNCSIFDFGLSIMGDSNSKFKKSMGGDYSFEEKIIVQKKYKFKLFSIIRSLILKLRKKGLIL